jgi:ubiquinone/menaquinone biosynthesis C-methylase UbiE
MSMMSNTPDWNSFARKQAGERWRKQSAAMGRALTELLVREAAVKPGMNVLDVACGSGEPAISIASQLNNAGRVIGVDISAEPLTVARQRATQRKLANIIFQQADVQRLPFEDATFDRVTCRLGLMFITNISQALGEIRRVLGPGGRFAAATWGPLAQPYFEVTIGTVRRIIPELNIPPVAASMFRFGNPDVLRSALSSAGFVDVESDLRTVPWNWEGTPLELWEYFQGVTVPFAPLLKEIPDARKPEVDRAVEAEIRRLYDGSVVRVSAQFAVAVARKA